MTGVSIRIRVASENVKVGGGRYLRDAHGKHSRYDAARPLRFGGGCREGFKTAHLRGFF